MDARSILQQVRGLIFAVFLTAGLLYLLLAWGSAPAPQIAAVDHAVSSVPAGSEGQLQNGKPVIPIAIDEELLPEISQVIVSADYSNALSSLSGRIFFVDNGTSVRVSETGSSGIRVRVLTGPEKGRLGWVPSDWVRPM